MSHRKLTKAKYCSYCYIVLYILRIKQVKDAQEKYNDDLHEMQKPLARYAGDQDLEQILKSRERDGDPMLQYIANNKEDDSPDGVRHSKLHKLLFSVC